MSDIDMKQLMEQVDGKYKRALVTGGAGFIASHICEQLVKNTGIRVVALDDYSAGKIENTAFLEEYENYEAVKCDVTDVDSLEKLMEREKFDIIFHNAASKKNICLKNPSRDLEVNAGGTLNLLTLGKKYGVKKFVHASTGSVYGEPKVLPQTEAHPLAPVSYYGVSKLAGDKYVQLFNELYDMDTTVLRYFHVYGTRQESNEFGGVVAIFTRSMIEGTIPTIFGDGTQERSFTHVHDVVKANMLVAVTPEAKGEAYNCASGIKVTINHLCDVIIDAFGKTGAVKPQYDEWLIGDIKMFNIDNTKLSQLGMTFEKDFDKKLRETMGEMRAYLSI